MAPGTILENAADERLKSAVEENLFALFRAMALLPGGQIEETPKLSRHLTFPNNPMYKSAWGTCLEADEVGDAIDDTIAWFKSRGAPFFFWWTGPSTVPENIGEHLTSRGMIDMEAQSREVEGYSVTRASGAPGMIADLYTMNENVLEQTPPGFEMHDVQTEKDLLDFKQVIVDGYGMPAAIAEGWVQAANGFGIGKTPWRMVLGRLDGEPVATNMVLHGAGVVGVYGVAVTPVARGKGIGAAISLKPLLEARDRDGYHHAVLFATEVGVPVYQRIGFRLTGGYINRYLWRNT